MDEAEEAAADPVVASRLDTGTSLDKGLKDVPQCYQESQLLELQQDLRSLLEYTLVLVRENNALKNIIRTTLTTDSNVDMNSEFCKSILSSSHDVPQLKSLSYDGETSGQAMTSQVAGTSAEMHETASASAAGDPIKKLYRLTFSEASTGTRSDTSVSGSLAQSMSDGSLASDMEPRFFTDDMLSLIQERNHFKEKVLRLEDELEIIHESATESVAVSPLSTTSPPKIFTPVIGSTERYISDACVVDYRKQANSNAHMFVITTTWSDGQRFELHRKYGEFFLFHRTLQQLFPIEAGKKRTNRRVLPILPSKIIYVLSKLRKSTFIDDLKAKLNDYCQTLLLRLPHSVSRAVFVVNFFKPYPKDRQLERLRKPRSQTQGADEIRLSVYPQNFPAGTSFERCAVLVDHVQSGDGEITMKAGETVTLLKKDDSGWWLVDRFTGENHEIGYVPGSFLKPLSNEEQVYSSDDDYLGFVSSTEVDPVLEYIAVEDYFSDDSRQISFSQGTQLILIEKSEDGWWLVAHDGQEGWAPASYIKAVNTGCDAAEVDSSLAQDFIAKESYLAQTEDEISFSKGSVVNVLRMCDSGWWRISFDGNTGVAPASLLTLNLAEPVDDVSLAYNAAAIFGPPPRRKQQRARTQDLKKERQLKLVRSSTVCVQTHVVMPPPADKAGVQAGQAEEDTDERSISGTADIKHECTGSQCTLAI